MFRIKLNMTSYLLFDTRMDNKTSNTKVVVTAYPQGEIEVYPGVIVPYWVLRERSLNRCNLVVFGSSEF